MIRALIVEDEVQGQELLRMNIQESFPECNIVGVVDNVRDAINLINQSHPNLLFLDIQLKGGTGFDVIENADCGGAHIVFITAYSQYAVKAIKARAFDYILKPINKIEFKEMASKIKEAVKEDKLFKESNKRMLGVKTGSGTEYIKLANIIYLEADGAMTRITMNNGETIVTSKNIGEFEDAISDAGFMRCHHSFMVNMASIEKYRNTPTSNILLSNGHTIPVSQRKRTGFVKALRLINKSNE